MNRNEMIKYLSENTTREDWVFGNNLQGNNEGWTTYCNLANNIMLIPKIPGESIITVDDVFEPVNEQSVIRDKMIKYLSENTTREDWRDPNRLEELIDNDEWGTFRYTDNSCLTIFNKSKNIRHGITIDDVFEPEQPAYIDGGIYEIGVMNGEPQQFVYNLKLNMFERGSNESIGASNIHDSKVVTHFKLVQGPCSERVTDRERGGSIPNIIKPMHEQPESLLRPCLTTDTEVFFNEKLMSDDDGDKPDSPSVLDKQEGGSHYKGKGVQPWEVIKSNDMGFFDGNALKYLMRHKDKNGAEDIRKAIHYLEAILEFEYGECDGNVRR